MQADPATLWNNFRQVLVYYKLPTGWIRNKAVYLHLKGRNSRIFHNAIRKDHFNLHTDLAKMKVMNIDNFYENYYKLHWVKSVRIRSISGPCFTAFGLNTERYGVSLRIQSECGKIRNRKTQIRTIFTQCWLFAFLF